ncbi:hypothetical protein RJ639_032590 [Escallonia herrerae]|uniref:Uncharacterized protein n=1 Tax=Escallonia herrerae TaxID=1293975 RepID=A0AA88WVX1_9ASTE|nr:hypothetical protein RJ639_032590 [Escallonia herrerae]
MASSEQSSHGYSVHSQVQNSEEPGLEFSEDEEALIIRMYNLIGERFRNEIRFGFEIRLISLSPVQQNLKWFPTWDTVKIEYRFDPTHFLTVFFC